jgi:hypothetical protein
MPAATDAPKHLMTSRGNSRQVIPVLSTNTTPAPNVSLVTGSVTRLVTAEGSNSASTCRRLRNKSSEGVPSE